MSCRSRGSGTFATVSAFDSLAETAAALSVSSDILSISATTLLRLVCVFFVLSMTTWTRFALNVLRCIGLGFVAPFGIRSTLETFVLAGASITGRADTGCPVMGRPVMGLGS